MVGPSGFVGDWPKLHEWWRAASTFGSTTPIIAICSGGGGIRTHDRGCPRCRFSRLWYWSFRRAERASISSFRAAAQDRLRALGRPSGSSAVAEAAPSLVRRFPRSFQLLGLQPALEAHGAHMEASR
jgi:hypothetical protein